MNKRSKWDISSKDALLQEGDIFYILPTVLAAMAMKIEKVIRLIARAFSGGYSDTIPAVSNRLSVPALEPLADVC